MIHTHVIFISTYMKAGCTVKCLLEYEYDAVTPMHTAYEPAFCSLLIAQACSLRWLIAKKRPRSPITI